MPACVSMAVSVSVCEHVGIGVGGGPPPNCGNRESSGPKLKVGGSCTCSWCKCLEIPKVQPSREDPVANTYSCGILGLP